MLDPDSTSAVASAEDAQPRIFGGFWRRFGALVIDWIIIWIAGNILGFFFFDFFSRLGTLGPLVGLGSALLYFGLQNSVLCGGQTLGKRLLGIEVVDPEGKLILPAHSVVRYLILLLPFVVINHAVLGPIFTTWTGLMLQVAISFWIGTIVYLFLFNVPSRQSLHDRMVSTYVVRTSTRGAATPSPFWPGHYVLLGLMGFGILGLIGTEVLLLQWGPFASLEDIQQAVQADARIEYVETGVAKNWDVTDTGSKATNSLDIDVFWNGKPDDMAAAARSVAATILTKAGDEVAKQDVLKINISYGYDIGIASSSVSSDFEHSPQEWRQIVADATPP